MDSSPCFRKARNDSGFCHFEPFIKGEKSAPLVILSVSEISKEFKIRFEFIDTPLRSV